MEHLKPLRAISMEDQNNIGIFDCNACGNGSGWCYLKDWKDVIVPHILENAVPRADGNWHITHSAEIILPWSFK